MKFKAFIIAASLAFACNAQAQDINGAPDKPCGGLCRC